MSIMDTGTSVSTQRVCPHSIILRVHNTPDARVGDPWEGGWACLVEDLGGGSCIIHTAPNIPGDNETEKMANARIILTALAKDGFELARWKRVRADLSEYWHNEPLKKYLKDGDEYREKTNE